MKREQGILIAGAVGLLTAFAIFAFRRMISDQDYHSCYSDYHRNFSKKTDSDDYHGIEYLALR